jgi:hypothetical protein
MSIQIALGQIAPRRTGSQHPKDAVQHAAVIVAGTPRGLLGSNGSITRHSKSARSYPAHGAAESEERSFEQPAIWIFSLILVGTDSKERVEQQLSPTKPSQPTG